MYNIMMNIVYLPRDQPLPSFTTISHQFSMKFTFNHLPPVSLPISHQSSAKFTFNRAPTYVPLYTMCTALNNMSFMNVGASLWSNLKLKIVLLHSQSMAVSPL